MESTLAFYEKAFDLKQKFLHESKQYGELSTGDTKLAFASDLLAQSNGVTFVKNNRKSVAPGFEIALETDDVVGSYKKALEAGALDIKEPTEKPWGQLIAYVRDLNGILIEICSPMG